MGLHAEAEYQADLFSKVAARDEARREEAAEKEAEKEREEEEQSAAVKMEAIWGTMKSGVEDMLASWPHFRP